MPTNILPNARILFNKPIAIGYPVPGVTTILDKSSTIDLNAPLNGGILIKVLCLSIDPYQRGLMRPGSHSYATPYKVGNPIYNFGVGIVLRSEHPKFKERDHVYGRLTFQEYIIEQDPSSLVVLENKENLPWSNYVGVAGMPGQTAYIGWKMFSKAKKGETVFVTAAGGPVGSFVIQLAKSQGLKVIASAGSDDKVAFAKEVGADVVFNYKTKDTADGLKELGHGIDIFWDNVGGKTLEAALDALNTYGRVINCGSIEGYNEAPYGVKNLGNIVTKRLSLQGFIVLDYIKAEIEEFYAVVPKKIASGQIKHREHVYRTLEDGEQAITDVQTGANKAKAVVLLA